jgi:hypothetical protein
MKRVATIAFLLFFALSSQSVEIPQIREVLNLGDDWRMVDERAHRETKIASSWSVLRNRKNDDLLSMRIERYEGNSNPEVYRGGPWTEATISAFPNGYRSTWGTKIEAVWSSNEITKLPGQTTAAVSFTTFWKDDEDRLAISHGYSFAVGPYRILIQHTSRRVITPEFVHAEASKLVKRLGEQDGSANGSQPTRSETNRTSEAAGSRR